TAASEAQRPQAQVVVAAPAMATADPVLGLIAELLRPHLAAWKPENASTPFFDLGLDSMVLLDVADTLERRLDVRLYPTVLFERSNAAALASYLKQAFPEACSRYAAQLPAVPAAATAGPAVPASVGRPQVLLPRWLPARPNFAPSPAQAIAL